MGQPPLDGEQGGHLGADDVLCLHLRAGYLGVLVPENLPSCITSE